MIRRNTSVTWPSRFLVIGLLCGFGAANAQYRDGLPPVAVSPPALLPAAAPRVVDSFSEVYRSAGRPRIALLWNRAFSDRIQSSTMDMRIDTESTRRINETSRRVLNGPAGPADSSNSRSSSMNLDRTTTSATKRSIESEAPRMPAIAERDSITLQRSFAQEMNRGGVRFIDRAMAIRMTAATRHRTGGDPLLIESDALTTSADLILEIEMIEDREAPMGYGFDIRAKDLRNGIEVASMYSRAIPHPSAMPSGVWVAGKHDYTYQAPSVAPPATMLQIGEVLAHDVMSTLAPFLRSAPLPHLSPESSSRR